ncbi:sugar ABC transporter ATP-binding protein [Micromonospora sp. FIMYZ51]|uniref:sugar ABC transporter ATP-binding protein n=1 Tax=Micromonospora sp. FIMYZ51 TaxID=3051832 RepID=UPI00311DC89C
MSVLRAENVSKSFSGVQVLHEVNLSLEAGKVVGLVGENGAGKSTLIKILSGLYRPDSGRLLLDGEPIADHWSHSAARAAGISVIHQELLLVPELSVAANIMLGDPALTPRRAGRLLGVRDDRASERRAEELLAQIGITNLDVRRPVRGLRPSDAQMVLIARSLRNRGKVLILDEPTAALAPDERTELFALIRRLLAAGTGILLVSHHLKEVEDLSDEVTVLRNGRVVETLSGDEITVPRMVHAMLDRALDDQFPEVEHQPSDEVVLQVDGLTREPVLRGVALTARRGEILGITGLLGAGKTEFARALVGLDPADGVVRVEGKDLVKRSPGGAIRDGVLLVPEERKAQAVFADLSVYRNGVVSRVAKGARALGPNVLFPGSAPLRKTFRRLVDTLGVRFATDQQPLSGLSGGNQQKLVIGRALACDPRVLILDEPTRGVDVGSKRDIYKIIAEQAAAGLAVLLISSDTREVLGLAHRILVFRDGAVAAEVLPDSVTNEELTVLLSPHASVETEARSA